MPLVIVQVWPQFRYLRVIYLGLFKKDEKLCSKEKKLLDSEIGLVEPFVEAEPQFYVLGCLALFDEDCFGPGKMDARQKIFWGAKMYLAVINFMIAHQKFQSNGPLARDYKNMWLKPNGFGGWVHNFLFLFVPINLFFGLYFIVAIVTFTPEPRHSTDVFLIAIIYGILKLPHVLLSSIMLFWGLDLKRALRAIVKCPNLVLNSSAVFSPVNLSSRISFTSKRSPHGNLESSVSCNCAWEKSSSIQFSSSLSLLDI